MRQVRALLLRLAALFRKAEAESEFSEELRSHVELHIEDNVRAGMSRQEARRSALLKLGGLEPTKEVYRERRGLPPPGRAMRHGPVPGRRRPARA